MKRIDVLPDEVLLEIFDFYISMDPSYEAEKSIEWQLLVHVCRRWRGLIFESPRRLNLQLLCTPKTPTRDKLGVWPALPISVAGILDVGGLGGVSNIIAALEQSNRVCRVSLGHVIHRLLQQVLAAMQVPFPELTYLQLSSYDEIPVIPDSFLGGSAPRLQSFDLSGIPFPGLPKLLLSATHLVSLNVSDIPHSGYISPEAMVALLSVLSSLKRLYLGFRYHQSRPYGEGRSLPPPKRSILPALRRLDFDGVSGYLEDFVNMIDAPQLEILKMTSFKQIDFDCPRLTQFINRAPKLGKTDEAHVKFGDWNARVLFGTLEMFILCGDPDRRLSSIAHVCNSSFPSTVEDLYIERQLGCSQLFWQNDATENTLWLQFLLPFAAVKNLYLSKQFVPGIAAALQALIGARITDVLPSLQTIFVEELQPSGPFQENIGQFVAARQLSDHPIVISDWHEVNLPDSDSDFDDNDSDMESM